MGARPSSNILPSRAELLGLYGRMLLIRKCEEQLARDQKLGRSPGQVHLSDGQEAVATGICAHLGASDQITSTHRGHGHYLAKGGDPRRMFAEIYGKAEGICGGMGGSMHVADFSLGILGANGIVGAGLSIATGAALANSLAGGDRVAVCFFGDGAANQGALMECLNIATLWRLPLLFVCENNGYSEFSPAATVTAGIIADRALPFGIPVRRIDGNDLLAVWTAAAQIIADIRAGNGPAFIEARTYRYSGHFGTEALVLDRPYRPDAEIEAARAANDPIDRLAAALLADHGVAQAELDAAVSQAETLVAECVAFGEAGTPPIPGSAQQLMFAPGAA